MKKLFPLLLVLVVTLAGAGAGYVLKPAPTEEAETCPPPVAEEKDLSLPGDRYETTGKEYVKLNNQFVVPVISGESVSSLVLLGLSLEVSAGDQERVFALEPKIRDALLQTMFDHANMGGFEGAFTNSPNLGKLRQALLETARKILGDSVSDVLILDVVRQSV